MVKNPLGGVVSAPRRCRPWAVGEGGTPLPWDPGSVQKRWCFHKVLKCFCEEIGADRVQKGVTVGTHSRRRDCHLSSHPKTRILLMC